MDSSRMIAIAAFLLFGCEPPSAATGTQTTVVEPARNIVNLTDFDPQIDPVAADAWSTFAPDRRNRLVEHYRSTGYNTMARLIESSHSPRSAAAAASAESDLSPRRACPEDDADALLLRDVDRMSEVIGQHDFARAVEISEKVSEKWPKSCLVAIEAALATVAYAANDGAVTWQQLEHAARTLITADIEMNLRPRQGSSEWPYTLLATALLERRAYSLAAAVAELGRDRIKTSGHLPERLRIAADRTFADLSDQAHAGAATQNK